MNCPRCQVPLVTERYEDSVDVDTCPQCGGTWVSREKLDRIQLIKEHDHSFDLRHDPDTVGASIEMARQRELPDVACPVCGAVCDRHEYGLASQVLIDRCPHDHGLWLDRGELEALEVYFERSRAEGNADAESLGGLWGTLMGYFGRSI
jgi:Zn-finger nucleic acid-binding protein